MPIKQLSKPNKPGMIIGTLHKGGEKTATGFGPDLDHWRFTSPNHPEIETAFHAAYGDAPRKINVYLAFATPDETFQYWCEIWAKSGLVHRCDGETAVLWRDGSRFVTGSKPCPGGHTVKNDVADPLNDAIGRLVVVIPELIYAGFVGYVTVLTKGKNDISHLVKVLSEVYENRKDMPNGLKGIMFDLARVQESISAPGFGKTAGGRTHVDKWLLKLTPSADWMQLQLEMAHKETMMLLDAPKAETVPADDDTSEPIEADPVTGEVFDEQWMDIIDEPDVAPVEAVVKSPEPVKVEPAKEPAKEAAAVKKSTPPAAKSEPAKANADPAPVAKVERPADVEAALSVCIPWDTQEGKVKAGTVPMRDCTTDQLKKMRTFITHPKYTERATNYAEALVACEILIEYFENGGK